MNIVDVAMKVDWEGGVFNTIKAMKPSFINDIEDLRLRKMFAEAKFLLDTFTGIEKEIEEFLIEKAPNI